MANPTGTVFLQANTNYVWADGDVYEIQQTDTIEGALSTASFSGLGVDNQPHQVLLNKINYTHTKQLADENTIAGLLAGGGAGSSIFTGAVGPNGYVQMAAQDSALGAITVIFQWGTISFATTRFLGQGHNNLFQFTFPIPFTTAVWWIQPYFQTNLVTGALAFTQGTAWSLETLVPIGLSTNKICADWDGQAQAPPITNPPAQHGLTGIGWMALGY